MKRIIGKMLAIVLSCMMIAAVFAGCGSAGSSTEAVVMNGETVTMDEMKIYAYTMQDKLEATYSWLIAYYGETYDNFWKGDSGYGTTMWEENVKLAIQQIVQTKVLVKYANENGITLTEEERARVQENIGKYHEIHATAAKYAGATDALIEKYYTENALANKAVMALQADVSTDFDYETFKRKRIVGISVTPKSTVPTETEAPTESPAETTEETTAEGYTKTPLETTVAPTETYSEDQKSTARSEALADIEKRLKNGEKPADIVEAYKDDATVTVASITEYAASSEDEVAEGEEKTSYKNYAWALSTGEVVTAEIANSNSTAATVIGYALRCENDDDPDYRKTAEDSELETRKTNMFQEKYQVLVEKVAGLHIYTDKIASAVSYKGQATVETTPAPTEATTAAPTEETTAAPEETTPAEETTTAAN